MARKTFISYKYSEAQKLRNDILKALGNDAIYYQGENSDSPDLTDKTTEHIKSLLTDMMYNTSVTIVIISPEMKNSKWINWEIEYCIKQITRAGRTSKKNGLVGVIMKVNGGYDWFKVQTSNQDGCKAISYKDDLLYDIIRKNRANQTPKKYICETCKTINYLNGSYISFIEEDLFLMDPNKYIENAFEKSEDVNGYC